MEKLNEYERKRYRLYRSPWVDLWSTSPLQRGGYVPPAVEYSGVRTFSFAFLSSRRSESSRGVGGQARPENSNE
jgi:hypothetical protein